LASRRCERFTGRTRYRSYTPWVLSLMKLTERVVEASRPASTIWSLQ